ncbi:MAG: hypothetical protein K6F32_00050 [Bacilli bacterium]|nr:hypothetical protein [Bacilli bacterium]
MNIQIRYLSKLGHTKAIAEAIAEGAKSTAVSISEEPELKEKADILFLGGAPYANVMDKELREYAKKLTPELVGEVILFTTSNWSKRTVKALRKILMGNLVNVREGYFFAQAFQIEKRKEAAKEFGASSIE